MWNIYSTQKETNRENKGLISVDRSNKTTLPLTIPRSIFKSSAKDLFLATSKLYMFGVRGLSPLQHNETQEPKLYPCSSSVARSKNRRT